MSKARALALPYAISKLLRQHSPHPVDAPGLVKIAQARGTRLTLDEVVAALDKLVVDGNAERLEGDQFRWCHNDLQER
jgi:Fe2+ or Zn2+ uptake regulation protein